jgi:hypothetical protein
MHGDTSIAAFGVDREFIHLLKIDVEGYELLVLRGAPRSLERTSAIALESRRISWNRSASRSTTCSPGCWTLGSRHSRLGRRAS